MLPLLQIDAFTSEPFAGNPAAVCFLDHERDDAWMQSVAAEMNLSETAFLLPPVGASDEPWSLRWFSPSTEIDLCGHATLASAHALWQTERLPRATRARFATRSGELSATADGARVELDFPATPATVVPATDVAPGLLASLGLPDRHPVLRSRFDYLVELADEAAVVDFVPDHSAFRGLAVRGVIITAATSRADADFVSRFFAPGAGVDEDPVTGSAHCTLAPFWSERLGRAELTGYQASKRGGTVRVRLAGDRVLLGGQAVTVLRGELTV